MPWHRSSVASITKEFLAPRNANDVYLIQRNNPAGWGPAGSESSSPPNTIPRGPPAVTSPRIQTSKELFSMESGSKKQIDVVRLKADMAAASVELLSAHCAADRIRLQYSPRDVASFTDRNALKRAITSSEAIYRFFSEVAAHID